MLLSHRQFFIKERIGLLKLTDTYDIYDPHTKMQIGIAREEPPTWAKFLRLAVSKRMLPSTVRVYERDGTPPLLTLSKKFTFLRAKALLTDAQNRSLGTFRSKILSLGGGFFILDDQGNKRIDVKADWKGWNFRLLSNDGQEMGLVTKQWRGIGQELLTSADNYVISINERAGSDESVAALLLAAGLAIDLVFKEG